MKQGHKLNDNATGPLFRCSQCPKYYKRPEHLQRHSAIHRPARDYRCERCGAAFQRSDVLTRHARTCDGTRSRRSSLVRRACDACVKDKRKCSVNPPCLQCRKRHIACTFTIAEIKEPVTDRRNDPTSDEGFDDPFLAAIPLCDPGSDSNGLVNIEDDALGEFFNTNLANMLDDDFDWTMLSVGRGNEERSLQFLESFTRNTGFVESFDCLTVEERNVAYTAFTSRIPITVIPGDKLLLKSQEIVTLIKETVEVKPRNNPVTLTWSAVVESLCVEFFSPRSTRLWLELYWAIWHPNVNFMHRPTFDASNSKSSLVAAMCIIGALVSPNQADHESARLWMNSVEEMVFRDDDVSYGGERPGSFPARGRLQSIQAMYMVCLFQNWEGDPSSKSRIRRFRYSTVVANVRDNTIKNARHPPYHLLHSSTFSWYEFVAQEELIRVLLWVFLLDTAFVIFNNVPPRMAIKEMKMHLACSEACFQAPTSDLCFELLGGDQINRKHTLSSLTRMMCKASIAVDDQALLADLGPLNLFVLTSALHSVIFQTQQVFGFETELGPVRTALRNWEGIWQIYCSSYAATITHCPLLNATFHPDNMWQRIGFVRYCSEYWLLAKLIVDRITNGSQSMEHAFVDNRLETDFGNDDQSTATILDSYDETSMRQVNDLISEFQKVIL